MADSTQEVAGPSEPTQKQRDFQLRYSKDNLEPGEAYVYNRRGAKQEAYADLYGTGAVPVEFQPHGVRRVPVWAAHVIRKQGIEQVRLSPEGDQVTQYRFAVRWPPGHVEPDDAEFGVPLAAQKPVESIVRDASVRTEVRRLA
jgi:hypothetical protein